MRWMQIVDLMHRFLFQSSCTLASGWNYVSQACDSLNRIWFGLIPYWLLFSSSRFKKRDGEFQDFISS